MSTVTSDLVAWFADLRRGDVARVGGKNASLGELVATLHSAGVNVPDGFATTARAYWRLLDANDLRDRMSAELDRLADDGSNLAEVGAAVRGMLLSAELPDDVRDAVLGAYRELPGRTGHESVGVAVRSSATAEDLPEASFAGQLETFLNVRGEAALLDAVRKCYASLFTDRAIAYRRDHGFDHMSVALSVGVQEMVRSDLAGSGVMFSLDTETGFPRSMLVTAAWGLGETVVQGMVDPDEYLVFTPLLDREDLVPIVEKRLGRKSVRMIYAEDGGTSAVLDTPEEQRGVFVLEDAEVLQLARWARTIADHYGQPMDMEWAKDGVTGELFVVQARPETVQSRKAEGVLTEHRLTGTGTVLATGVAVGDGIATGRVCRLDSAAEIARFIPGSVLVTGMTDPDWVPIMRQAAAIVTDHGGRTSHAAIVSRELGLTAVVGTGNGTALLEDGAEVTVSCAQGEDGVVYAGAVPFEVNEIAVDDVPETRTKVMLNLANPATAFRWWRLPSDGVGLARMEFIIGNLIRIHPMALVHFDEVADPEVRAEIESLTAGYADKTEFFVDALAHGVARIAAAHHPDPVILRMSDFKTNEYAALIGGASFEPHEENPMLGWRGASRYYSEGYRAGFDLECRAVRRAREEIGLDNVVVMIPFCRTLDEADRVLAVMAENGLERGRAGLQVYVMAEIPSNVLLAERFAERFDGFSIGSNDLTQLTLGVDRDSGVLSDLFDERDPAVEAMIAQLLETAGRVGAHTGICGQAPSDHPEFAAFLVEHGIESVSVSPDSFLEVKRVIAAAESGLPA